MVSKAPGFWPGWGPRVSNRALPLRLRLVLALRLVWLWA